MNATDEIMQDLEKRITRNNQHKIFNRRCAVGCLMVAILGSLAATVAAAMNSLPNWLQALVSALPGAALLLNKTLRFDLKEQWHHDKVFGLSKFRDQLYQQQPYTSEELARLKQKIDAFDEKLKEKHPNYGKYPHKMT